MSREDEAASEEAALLLETIVRIQALIEVQARTLDLCIHRIREASQKTGKHDPIFDTIPLLLQSIGSSNLTVRTLSAKPGLQIKDCYPIGRAITEAAINVGYICGGGSEIAKRALQHASQRKFRDMNREATLAGVHVTIKSASQPDPSLIPELQAALQAFTTAKGKAIRDWTPDGIDQRISVIGAQFGTRTAILLITCYMMIYQHASEIVHGSVYGCIYFLTGGSGRHKDLLWHDHAFAVLSSVLFANLGAMFCVSKQFDCPDIGEIAEDLERSFLRSPYMARLHAQHDASSGATIVV